MLGDTSVMELRIEEVVRSGVTISAVTSHKGLTKDCTLRSGKGFGQENDVI